VAVALEEGRGALIVGKQSRGKALIQGLFPFSQPPPLTTEMAPKQKMEPATPQRNPAGVIVTSAVVAAPLSLCTYVCVCVR